MNCHSCDVLIMPRKMQLDVAKFRSLAKNCSDCVKTCVDYKKKKGKVPATCRDYVSNNKMLIKILEKISKKPIKMKKNIINTFPKDLETKHVSFSQKKRIISPQLITPVHRFAPSASQRPISRPSTTIPRVVPSRSQGSRGTLGPRGISGLNTRLSTTTQRPSGPRRPPTTQIVHPDYEALGFNTSRPRGVHPAFETPRSSGPTQGPRGAPPGFESLGFNTSRPRGIPSGFEAMGLNSSYSPTTQGPREVLPAYETLGFNTGRPTTTQGPRRGAPSGFEGLGFNTSPRRGAPSGFEAMGLNSSYSPTTQGPSGPPPAYEARGFNTSRSFAPAQVPRRSAPSGFEAHPNYEEIMRRLNAA